MKIEKLREMTAEGLADLEKEQREKIFKLRFHHSLGQLESSASTRTSRKDLARVLTAQNEKRRSAKA